MRKHCCAGLILLAIILFSALNLSAQEPKNEQLWYCWEETVNPATLDEYLSFSKELLELCKHEDFPYPIFTWTRRAMVYELWSPIPSMEDVDKIDEEWDKILKIWGKEKQEAFNQTKLKHYSKICTIDGNMTYMPAIPELSADERTYGRWIELYLKPGKMDEMTELVERLNEQRAEYGAQEYVQFGKGEIGYQAPCFLVIYMHKSQLDFENYLDTTSEAYQEKFQQYLKDLQKLLAQPPELYDYFWLQELSYQPEEQ